MKYIIALLRYHQPTDAQIGTQGGMRELGIFLHKLAQQACQHIIGIIREYALLRVKLLLYDSFRHGCIHLLQLRSLFLSPAAAPSLTHKSIVKGLMQTLEVIDIELQFDSR